MISDMDIYLDNINVVEEAVIDDDKFPVIKNNKVKNCCLLTMELIKTFLNNVKYNIKNASKKNK